MKPFIPAWLDDLGLSQAEFRLFCHLCRRADKNGIAFPSVDGRDEKGDPKETSIISVCGMARRTAWKTINRLIDLKLIEKLKKRNFQSSNSYRILFPTSANEAPVESPIDANEAPVVEVPTDAIEAPPIDANGTLQLTQSRPREGNPSKVLQSRESKKSTNKELFSTGEILPFDSDEFREAWSGWREHLDQKPKNKRPTPSALKGQLRRLSAMGERASIAALWNSIEKNYQGIYQDPDFQPDGGRATYEDVLEYATENGISESTATIFYDESVGKGWRDFNGPFQDWRANFRAFVERKGERESRAGGIKPHRQRGYQENLQLP